MDLPAPFPIHSGLFPPGKPIIKPSSLAELSLRYSVSKKTFKRWLSPFHSEIGPRLGHFYSIHQVRVIYEKLGVPE